MVNWNPRSYFASFHSHSLEGAIGLMNQYKCVLRAVWQPARGEIIDFYVAPAAPAYSLEGAIGLIQVRATGGLVASVERWQHASRQSIFRLCAENVLERLLIFIRTAETLLL